MEYESVNTAADPDVLCDRLPPAPGDWTRTNDRTGTVEYRLPDDETPCTAGKLTVRPDVLGDDAVRLDRTVNCRSAGTDRFESVDDAVRVVDRELRHATDRVDDGS